MTPNDDKFVYQAFQIEFIVESIEENGTESSSYRDSFEFFAIQKK
jgi:hypothetical protein